MKPHRFDRLRTAWLGVAGLTLCLVGCGDRPAVYQVEGQVTLAAGAPLADCRVVFDKPGVSATAVTDAEGRFRLGTFDLADGVPAGTYRVLVAEPLPASLDEIGPSRFDPRYSNFETSGFEFTVRSGRNVSNLKLD